MSREMIRQYEIGNSAAGADVLAKLAGLGFDTQYLLTGVRSANLPVADERGRYEVEQGGGALSREEAALLELFRQLRPSDRTHIKAVVSSLASASEISSKKDVGS